MPALPIQVFISGQHAGRSLGEGLGWEGSAQARFAQQEASRKRSPVLSADLSLVEARLGSVERHCLSGSVPRVCRDAQPCEREAGLQAADGTAPALGKGTLYPALKAAD